MAVGSLLPGLHDDQGRLQHVGVTSSFTMARRREPATELAPLRENAMMTHAWHEWPQRRERPQSRLRHATTFLRWRSDRRPEDCRYNQLETTRPCELGEVFGAGSKR